MARGATGVDEAADDARPMTYKNTTQNSNHLPWASLNMFFLRSMICRPPWGVISPTSPVRKKPSSSVCTPIHRFLQKPLARKMHMSRKVHMPPHQMPLVSGHLRPGSQQILPGRGCTPPPGGGWTMASSLALGWLPIGTRSPPEGVPPWPKSRGAQLPKRRRHRSP